MPTLGDVTALLDEWYPPHTADDWDAVGLVCGDPDADVRRILLAVDPVTAVADEAIEAGAQLLVTHHPLFLKGVHGVAATDPKGRVVHRLLGAGCGLFTAHTNADAPAGGVSESLALALGLVDPRPLEPQRREIDKFVVFAPAEAAEGIRAALVGAGAGTIGDYDSASFTSAGEGRFRPLDGRVPPSGRSARSRPSTRSASRWSRRGAPRPRARQMRRRIPTRNRPTTSSSSPPRRPATRLGPDRPALRADRPPGVRRAGRLGAARDRPRCAGRG